MSPTPDVDFDRLAAALARLLADWWRQQADRHGEAAPWSGAADAEAPMHDHASPGAPTTSSIAAARPSQEVEP